MAGRDAFALILSVPGDAQRVTLPHDAMIREASDPESPNKGNTGYRNGHVYTYVKKYILSQDDPLKVKWLKFEGVYMNCTVYINGQRAGERPYGYSVLCVDMSPYLHAGENEIRVVVRNGAMTNSRWYSGGGIYRDVYLLEGGDAWFVPEETFIRCESIRPQAGEAVVMAEALIQNTAQNMRDIRVSLCLYDKDQAEAAREEKRMILPAGSGEMMRARISVARPYLWSEQQPYMYRLCLRLYEDGTLLDEIWEDVGMRSLSLVPGKGLFVNGEMVKLRGACIHHDSGLLGAATYEDAQVRQIKLLKEAGFNAVRMAHNPMAPAMLRACDRLGMYVMDESFDMWTRSKTDYDYGLYFSQWWEKDIASMVKKDRNHPCVIMYSIGNEIPEIGTRQGSLLCAGIAQKVREYDDTRYVLASINGLFAAGDAMGLIAADLLADMGQTAEGMNVNEVMGMMGSRMDDIIRHDVVGERIELASSALDVVGYNYMSGRYEQDSQKYPQRIIVGSETNPPDIARDWALVKKLPNVIGDFTWTGWDYIGEAGIGIPAYRWGEGGFGAAWPCQLAYCGDFDITGFRRPLSYYREIVYGLRKTPYISVQPPAHYGEMLIKTPWILSDSTACWTWDGFEGRPVVVEVYTPGDESELILNGRSLGRRPVGEVLGAYVTFDTVYETGELTAVAYEQGRQIGTWTLATADRDRHLSMKNWEGDLDGLIYVEIEVHDSRDRLAMDEDKTANVHIRGGALMGFGSGNPRPEGNYTGSSTRLYQGRCLLILKREALDPALESRCDNPALTVTVTYDGRMEETLVLA